MNPNPAPSGLRDAIARIFASGRPVDREAHRLHGETLHDAFARRLGVPKAKRPAVDPRDVPRPINRASRRAEQRATDREATADRLARRRKAELKHELTVRYVTRQHRRDVRAALEAQEAGR